VFIVSGHGTTDQRNLYNITLYLNLCISECMHPDMPPTFMQCRCTSTTCVLKRKLNTQGTLRPEIAVLK